MAIIKKGIFGNVSGAIGDVQGARWKGRDTLQSRNTVGCHNVTTSVVNQRVSFASCRFFLSLIKQDVMDIATGGIRSNLPKWALWIKLVAKSYPTTLDWNNAKPFITVGRKLPSPDLDLEDIVSSGENWLVRISFRNAPDFEVTRLYTLVYSSVKQELLVPVQWQINSGGVYSVLLSKSKVAGLPVSFFAFFANPAVKGAVGNSDCLVFTF
jgi:hypothetical protein